MHYIERQYGFQHPLSIHAPANSPIIRGVLHTKCAPTAGNWTGYDAHQILMRMEKYRAVMEETQQFLLLIICRMTTARSVFPDNTVFNKGNCFSYGKRRRQTLTRWHPIKAHLPHVIEAFLIQTIAHFTSIIALYLIIVIKFIHILRNYNVERQVKWNGGTPYKVLHKKVTSGRNSSRCKVLFSLLIS